MIRFIILILFIIFIPKSHQFDDVFHEELFLKPLKTGHVNSYFQFTTKWYLNENDSRKVFFPL